MNNLVVVEGDVVPDTNAIAAYVVPLYLDFQAQHAEEAIARMVSSHFGIAFGVRELQALYDTDEFGELWPLQRTGNPRVDVARQAVNDLLPAAINAAIDMLGNPSTPATVRLRLVQMVVDLTGMAEADQKASNKDELTRFLSERGATITQINAEQVTVVQGSEYQQVDRALEKPGEISLIDPL